MRAIWYLLTFVFLLVVIGLAILFFYRSSYYAPPVPTDLEACNALSNNAENGINIVFFSDEENARKYIDYFLEFSPFDELKNKFNFFYIQDYSPQCEVYKNVAILCYSRELVKKAGSCPNDYIVVLSDYYSGSIRSSAYLNVMSINVKHPASVLAHEFGHAFANLAEEYVPAKIPRGAKNCPEACTEFVGREDGCYEGCSEASRIRSIENGIMRTLSSTNYGSFNNWLISEKILGDTSSTSISGRAVSDLKDCLDKEYYLFEGNYSDGRIEITGGEIVQGCVGSNGAGGFNISLTRDDGGEIEVGEFNPELIFSDAPKEFEDGIDGETYLSERPFFLKVPIVKGIRGLVVKDNENNVLTKIDFLESEVSGISSVLGSNTWTVYANDTSGNSVTFVVLSPSSKLSEAEDIAFSPPQPSFDIAPLELNMNLADSDEATREIKVANNGETNLTIDVEILGSAGNKINLSTNQLVLASGEEGSVLLSASSTETGIYSAKIVFKSGDLVREVFVLMNIESEEKALEVSLSVPSDYKVIYKGENLKVSVFVEQINPENELNFTINFVIKDFNDNLLHEESETRSIFLTEKFEKEFKALDFPEGDYIISVSIAYPEGFGASGERFRISRRFVDISLAYVIVAILLVVIVLVVLLMLIRISRKRKRKAMKNSRQLARKRKRRGREKIRRA